MCPNLITSVDCFDGSTFELISSISSHSRWAKLTLQWIVGEAMKSTFRFKWIPDPVPIV